MLRFKKIIVSFAVLLILLLLQVKFVFGASGIVLKIGMRGETVSQLQKDLKKLGFMDVDHTGYFGVITKAAVTNFQKDQDLLIDGIAGKQTLGQLDKLLERETTAYRGSDGKSGYDIVDYAKRLLGVKYVWGGTTTKGFDCSGYVKYVYNHFGTTLNRVSRDQAKNGTQVKKAGLLPGDLVFFDTNGRGKKINHVGIYIGGGEFIHASSSHKKVTISDITSGFYARTYMTARRIVV